MTRVTQGARTGRSNAPTPEQGSASGYTHVLLVRHGRTANSPGRGESERSLSAEGAAAVEQVARRLAEHLSLGGDTLTVGQVVHGEYRQVHETVRRLTRAMLAEQLAPPPVSVSDDLNPKRHWADGSLPAVINQLVRRPCTSPANGRALVVVGHEPQLSAIAARLLGRFGHPRRLVTPSAGVSCIRLGAGLRDRPRLLWVIEPSDAATETLLREKVKSKIDVAKVFGSIVTLLLGIVLNALADANKSQGLQHPGGVQLAAGLLALALVLYVSSLYAFDSLLMPARYWNSTGRRRNRTDQRPRYARRPPSSATLVLQQNMVGVWSGPFTLANLLVLVAIGLLAWGVLPVGPAWIAGAGALALAGVWWGRRIDLGTHD